MNILSVYAETPSIAREIGYEMKTTYWGDYRVAVELDGEKGVADTYKRSLPLAKEDRVYGTELALVLNWLMWYYHDKKEIAKSHIFEKYYLEWNKWVLDNWKGEDLDYYLEQTD